MSEKIATRNAYGQALVELGEENDKVVVLDADLSNATMTKFFAAKFPDRFFDSGIAEANMTDMAAGLSTMGYIPFASTFAIFGTGRAYEMVRNSIAYPHFNVKIACTHSGITVGEDGGSHQSIEDIALMRVIPGMTVIVPSDANEAKKAVKAAAEMYGPVYLRFSRPASEVLPEAPFEIGKANVLRDGDDGVIFCCGLMVKPALDASDALRAEGKSVAVVNVHTIKPLDEETVLHYALKTGKVMTVEEHSVIGGLGSAIAEAMRKECKPIEFVGINDTFGSSAHNYNDILNYLGLTVEHIESAIQEIAAL